MLQRSLGSCKSLTKNEHPIGSIGRYHYIYTYNWVYIIGKTSTARVIGKEISKLFRAIAHWGTIVVEQALTIIAWLSILQESPLVIGSVCCFHWHNKSRRPLDGLLFWARLSYCGNGRSIVLSGLFLPPAPGIRFPLWDCAIISEKHISLILLHNNRLYAVISFMVQSREIGNRDLFFRRARV